MAKAKRKAVRAFRAEKPEPPKPEKKPIAGPTPEQYGKGNFARNTMAYRRIPVIDTMAQTGKLSQRQFNGLSRYRDIAIAEERSPMRDSLDKALHGRAGATDGTGYIRTAYELSRLEQALGSLYPIARAIAVDDMTVSQYAASKGGTNADGSPKRVWAETSMMDIQSAGDELAKAIGA
jgi:hypothetical protein